MRVLSEHWVSTVHYISGWLFDKPRAFTHILLLAEIASCSFGGNANLGWLYGYGRILKQAVQRRWYSLRKHLHARIRRLRIFLLTPISELFSKVSDSIHIFLLSFLDWWEIWVIVSLWIELNGRSERFWRYHLDRYMWGGIVYQRCILKAVTKVWTQFCTWRIKVVVGCRMHFKFLLSALRFYVVAMR